MSDEVFAAAGRALAQAHRFERNLKGLAALVRSIHTAGEAPFDAVSFSKLSIGPLIDAARRFVDFDPEAEGLLEEARVRRNALCHSYFQDHHDSLATPEGQRRAATELRKDELLFGGAADLCSILLQGLNDNLEAMIASRGNVSPSPDDAEGDEGGR